MFVDTKERRLRSETGRQKNYETKLLYLLRHLYAERDFYLQELQVANTTNSTSLSMQRTPAFAEVGFTAGELQPANTTESTL